MRKPIFWTDIEEAYVDGLVRAGVLAGRCFHLFPGRSPDSISSKFSQHRKKLGLPAPGKGQPLSPSPSAARDRRKPVFVVSTELVPEPKQSTETTPEAFACQALLRRHLETGAHWLKPDRIAAARQQAGIA